MFVFSFCVSMAEFGSEQPKCQRGKLLLNYHFITGHEMTALKWQSWSNTTCGTFVSLFSSNKILLVVGIRGFKLKH